MAEALSANVFSFDDQLSRYLILISIVSILAIVRWVSKSRPDPNFPVIKIERSGLLGRLLPAKIFFFKDGWDLVSKGLSEYNAPFQVPAAAGYKIIFPNRYADELRNHPDLSFNEAMATDFFVGYPGFEAFTEGLKDDSFLQEVVRVKLTQSLGLITDDLVDETDASLNDVLGNDSEFHSIPAKSSMLEVVARLSSRVLLGATLAHDPDWLDITKNYTVDLFKSAQIMKLFPGPLQPLIYWVLPICARLRRQVRTARRLVMSEVNERRDRAQKALDAGEKPPKQADAIAWMVEVAQSQGRQPDYVAAQLSLSMAAIHTTSETALNAILQLCENPELIPALRKEVIGVLTTDGWSKQTLYKLRLMDSFLRETQRVRGMACTSMARLAKKDVALSNGKVLRAGSRILVHDTKADNVPHPHQFDMYRNLKLREQEGEENRHQMATLSSHHMVFGYGVHACPGRFFAANELKIFLAFMLLRYEFRYVQGKGQKEEKPRYFTFEISRMTDPNCRIELRRRREEIDLLDPAGKVKAGS